jgi:DNA (cytosine-5)-methyltransferase 1
LNELALFAGAGGGILGGHLLGWRTVCAVEWEAYPASVLCARQNDGLLPPFPIWDDIQTFDGKPWRGIVDVVSGGFPCTDISAAGKGAGIDGEASGMWREMARIIHEVRPRYAFVENSPMLTARGLGRVLGDLAAMGFDARWGVLGAADIGAKHQRDRIWVVGKATDSTSLRPHNEENQRVLESQRGSEFYSEQSRHPSKVAYSQQQGLERQPNSGEQEIARLRGCGALADTKDKGDVWREWELGFAQQEHDSGRGTTYGSREWWSVEPAVGRVVNGVAARVDRLKAIGNGQVPQCAATAWRILSEQ